MDTLQTSAGNCSGPCPVQKTVEQATYQLNGHTLKTSTFALASSSMSSRAMKQAIDTRIVLGCQSEQEVQSIFRFIWILTFFRWIVLYIYIRLVCFQCKVTILFTVFKLAPVPLTCTQRATAATKYSVHVPTPPPAPDISAWPPSPSRRYMK